MIASVYIVDDSDPVREMVQEFLELEPDLAVCGAAASGEEALASLPSQGCDLVLVDMSMPGMTGVEFVQRLARAAPGLLCLMYSAHVEEVYVRQAQAAGAAGFVTKGNPATLLDAIRQVLAGEQFFSEPLERTRRGW